MQFLATCDPGLEEIAIQEVLELTGNRAKIHHKGAIIFKGKEDDIFILNYLSRSLNRILILLLHDNFKHLEELYRKIKSLDFTQYIYPTQTFAIRAERFGTHNFTSLDIARYAGKAVIDSYLQSKGVRLKVNLDNPNIILRVEVRDDNFFIGIDTTGEQSLHKRWYRKFPSRAPLKSTIAYGMIRLADLKKNERFIDPFCGCGTIPIEAYLYLNKIPPGKFRSFDFLKFFFLDRQKFFKLVEKSSREESREELEIYGSDISLREVEFAKKNAEEAGAKIEFFKADACELELNYDVIVTDLPFGIRTPKRGLEETYKKFFSNLIKYDWKKLVFITAKRRVNLVPDLGFDKIIEIKHGDIDALVFVKIR